MPVPLHTRVALCNRFQIECKWGGKDVHFNSRWNNYGVELGVPPMKPVRADLAEVGGECVFSSIYYLLCGKKSGKSVNQFFYGN